MGVQAQRRNPAMVGLLGADFLRLKDPPRTIRVSTTLASVSSPPLNAELDALFDIPANLPENSFYLLYISDSTPVEMWLVVSDATNNNWWLEQLTVAV